MAAITICNDFGAPQNKVWQCFHYFPIYLHEVMEPDAMILVFWMLSFKPVFSLSSFTFIKRLFSSSLLSAIRVVSSAYLRLLLFLPAILIPAWAASSLAFHMIYSAYQSWIFTGRTDAEAETPILWPPDAKNPTHLKRPWCWERLKAGGEGDDRSWDGWRASLTQWTWVCVNSGNWWWTGRPGVLQ